MRSYGRGCSKVIKLELLLAVLSGYLLALLTLLSPVSFDPAALTQLTDLQGELSVRSQRLLCWVVTFPAQHHRARNILRTWGKRCDTLVFVSSAAEEGLPILVLPIKEESRRTLWRKANLTLRNIYDKYYNTHDWFFKADDDTYALIDNLRTHLATLNASQPLFVGHQFAYGAGDISYLSGGAGYVLSREAMRRLVQRGLEQDLCPYRSFTGEEDDVVITECLKKLGAAIPDTRDAFDNHRFLSCNVLQCLEHKVGPYDCQSRDQRRNCLSRRPFAFHYVKDTDMLVYEYLLYEAKTVESNFEGPCW